MTILQLIYIVSLINGHWGYSHFLTIVTKAAIGKRPFVDMLAFLLALYIKVECLDKVSVCLSLLETTREFSKVSGPFYTHQQ